MIFDTHMHCQYSCDSHMDIQDAIAAGKQQDIGIIVTEHWDYDYPTNPEAFIFDIDEYLKELQVYCSNKILAGIEIGMQTHIAAENDKIAAAYNFDYVLGSIHCVNKKDIYEKSFYNQRDKDDVTQEFLKESIICVQEHQQFDAFAHIDYICRYWPYEEKEFDLQKHQELFDRLFSVLIAKNKPLEINSRRLDNAKSLQALAQICRRYRYLGGKYCTLGSDAHYQEHVGRRMDVCNQLAMQADLQPVYFKERKMYLLGV